MTLNTRNQINIPDPGNPEEGSAVSVNKVLKIECVYHVEFKYILE